MQDETISSINLITNTPTTPFISLGSFHPSGLAITSDGSKLYATSIADGQVDIIDTAGPTISTTFSFPTANSVAITPNNSSAYVTGGSPPGVLVINNQTETVSDTITSGLTGGLIGIAIEPAGNCRQLRSM